MEKSKPTWNHPGGKLIELGPAALTDEELLAIKRDALKIVS